jgi:hypothetical protein
MGSGDRRRVILDTDAKNEADDQFAIVHALLSPTLDVRGIIPAHFGRRRTDRSMLESRAEVDLLLDLLDMRGRVRVENGAPTAMPDEVRSLGDSPAVGLMLNMGSGLLRRRPAPSFTADGSYAPGSGRSISVCEAIDARYLLEDMFAKLAAHSGFERGER